MKFSSSCEISMGSTSATGAKRTVLTGGLVVNEGDLADAGGVEGQGAGDMGEAELARRAKKRVAIAGAS